ncbi:rhodanese-like domain-containing protein [Halodesulfovibrio sp. MK-HDV]|jgi:rhodanese-related sulfurtransferase|uniref:rhodanese-like domain-containing protein n=1 Tax=Halodesulfovibrio sp. MK-HDV TaxID=2599925 RepID=UPI001369C2BF|nr:rhodanese-like domain-containing protein [Halodesulfovibrio sp. MK-HDV]KAF1074223.1 putative adenylyltransferase/sulfurtransferase MoeZ [Halodesulfovibrio sp. MK-HDV]
MRCSCKLFLVMACLAVASVALAGSLERLSASEVHSFLTTTQKPIVILDVRTPKEYAAGHIRGALLYDYYDEGFERKLSLLPKNVTYVVYCAVGFRSLRAARFLQKMSNDVIHMDGGIKEWKRLEYPVVK